MMPPKRSAESAEQDPERPSNDPLAERMKQIEEVIASSEMVLFVVDEVRHGNQTGTLYMLKERIALDVHGTEHLFSHRYADIHAIYSRYEIQEVPLIIEQKNGDTTTVFFENGNRAKSDREDVGVRLREQIEAFKYN